MSLQFAVRLPVDRVDLGAEFTSADGLAHCARVAERCGFAAAYVTDHPAPGDAWLNQGGHHSVDPFVALGYAAACTSRLKLLTNILVLPYRNPLLVSKAAASLDVLSGGRLILGLGAGYLEAEFRALGVALADRGRAMEEGLEALRCSWRGESFSFFGSGFEAEQITMLPRPAQRPHPPIWVGGNSRAAMRRAARYGDGWLPFPVQRKLARHVRTREIADLASLADAIGELRGMEREFSRERPLDICMIPFGLDMHADHGYEAGQLLEQCAQLVELGVNWISVSLPAQSRQDYEDVLSRFSSGVIQPLS